MADRWSAETNAFTIFSEWQRETQSPHEYGDQRHCRQHAPCHRRVTMKYNSTVVPDGAGDSDT